MTSKTRWVAIDIHHSTRAGLPPYHSILCTYHSANTTYCTYEMPWDLRYLLFYHLSYILYGTWCSTLFSHLSTTLSLHISVWLCIYYISYLQYLSTTTSRIYLYLVLFYSFLYEILYYYLLRTFSARYLVAYPIYIPYILCRHYILYHLFYLSTISRVFLYLVVSMYIGTISWMV